MESIKKLATSVVFLLFLYLAFNLSQNYRIISSHEYYSNKEHTCDPAISFGQSSPQTQKAIVDYYLKENGLEAVFSGNWSSGSGATINPENYIDAEHSEQTIYDSQSVSIP